MARNDIYYLATNINHAFMLYEEHATDIMMPEYIKYLKLYGSTEQYFYPLINVDSGNGEQIYYILAITDNYPKTSIGVDSISVNGMDVKMIIIPKKHIGLYNSIIMQNKILEYIRKDTKKDFLEEERRLFYVALTRAKNNVYLFTPRLKSSIFVKELIKNYNIINSIGFRSFGDN